MQKYTKYVKRQALIPSHANNYIGRCVSPGASLPIPSDGYFGNSSLQTSLPSRSSAQYRYYKAELEYCDMATQLQKSMYMSEIGYLPIYTPRCGNEAPLRSHNITLTCVVSLLEMEMRSGVFKHLYLRSSFSLP